VHVQPDRKNAQQNKRGGEQVPVARVGTTLNTLHTGKKERQNRTMARKVIRASAMPRCSREKTSNTIPAPIPKKEPDSLEGSQAWLIRPSIAMSIGQWQRGANKGKTDRLAEKLPTAKH
jgi:hypothetical protein